MGLVGRWGDRTRCHTRRKRRILQKVERFGGGYRVQRHRNPKTSLSRVTSGFGKVLVRPLVGPTKREDGLTQPTTIGCRDSHSPLLHFSRFIWHGTSSSLEPCQNSVNPPRVFLQFGAAHTPGRGVAVALALGARGVFLGVGFVGEAEAPPPALSHQRRERSPTSSLPIMRFTSSRSA